MKWLVSWLLGRALDELFESKTNKLIKTSIRTSQFTVLQNRQMTVASILDGVRGRSKCDYTIPVSIPVIEDAGYVVRERTVGDFLNTAEAYLTASFEVLATISKSIDSSLTLPDNFDDLIPIIKINQGRAINIIDELNKLQLCE